METLSFVGPVYANFEKESAQDLRRIRVYHGVLRGFGGFEDGDDLGRIPFGKMDALEAVAIFPVTDRSEGSFSALLFRPSLKLLQMQFSDYPPEQVMNRIAEDVRGRRAEQVETLVLLFSRDRFVDSLDTLLGLFPNLKSLRVSVWMPSRFLSFEWGRLLCRKLQHLSELVLEHDSDDLTLAMSDNNEELGLFLCGLGNEWAIAPADRRSQKPTLHFVASGRDQAEYSSYFFEDKFFKQG